MTSGSDGEFTRIVGAEVLREREQAVKVAKRRYLMLGAATGLTGFALGVLAYNVAVSWQDGDWARAFGAGLGAAALTAAMIIQNIYR